MGREERPKAAIEVRRRALGRQNASQEAVFEAAVIGMTDDGRYRPGVECPGCDAPRVASREICAKIGVALAAMLNNEFLA